MRARTGTTAKGSPRSVAAGKAFIVPTTRTGMTTEPTWRVASLGARPGLDSADQNRHGLRRGSDTSERPAL